MIELFTDVSSEIKEGCNRFLELMNNFLENGQIDDARKLMFDFKKTLSGRNEEYFDLIFKSWLICRKGELNREDNLD